jgi:hypothetical protein
LDFGFWILDLDFGLYFLYFSLKNQKSKNFFPLWAIYILSELDFGFWILDFGFGIWDCIFYTSASKTKNQKISFPCGQFIYYLSWILDFGFWILDLDFGLYFLYFSLKNQKSKNFFPLWAIYILSETVSAFSSLTWTDTGLRF